MNFSAWQAWLSRSQADKAVALLSSALSVLNAGGEAQLLPAGRFAARDGRPGVGRYWEVTDAQGERIAASMNAIASRTPIVIDYDHQTLYAEKNGSKALAAGWIIRVEWRKGQGLWAQVDWTQSAKDHIHAGEYRYISPVIRFDERTGEVVDVVMAALLNLPAIVGMESAVAQLSSMVPRPSTLPSAPSGMQDAVMASFGLTPAQYRNGRHDSAALRSHLEAPTQLGAPSGAKSEVMAAFGLTLTEW